MISLQHFPFIDGGKKSWRGWDAHWHRLFIIAEYGFTWGVEHKSYYEKFISMRKVKGIKRVFGLSRKSERKIGETQSKLTESLIKKFYQNENCLHTLSRDKYISMAILWFRRACDVFFKFDCGWFKVDNGARRADDALTRWFSCFHLFSLDFLWHLSSDCNSISRCHKASAKNFIDWKLINRVSTSPALKATQWSRNRRFHVQ